MSQRTNPLAPGAECGIDETMIRRLVHAFYARVRVDTLLGPIFNAAIDDWEAHLDKLCAFWSSVALMTGRYKGTPMQAHAALPDIDDEHFERWLALFADTAREHCPPVAATFFAGRAARIAQSLQMGIALHRGELISPLKGVAR
ncbi:MAG: group III truncated hemoglobin [Hyphomicrobiaceae bacterium]